MKEWFSAKELADLGLPSLGKTKRAVSYRAKAENWPSRPREGQGGGRERGCGPAGCGAVYRGRGGEDRDRARPPSSGESHCVQP